MIEELNKEYLKLREFEIKYAITWDELEQYKEIQNRIKEIRHRMENK